MVPELALHVAEVRAVVLRVGVLRLAVLRVAEMRAAAVRVVPLQLAAARLPPARVAGRQAAAGQVLPAGAPLEPLRDLPAAAGPVVRRLDGRGLRVRRSAQGAPARAGQATPDRVARRTRVAGQAGRGRTVSAPRS